jgi:hypothetical protein
MWAGAFGVVFLKRRRLQALGCRLSGEGCCKRCQWVDGGDLDRMWLLQSLHEGGHEYCGRDDLQYGLYTRLDDILMRSFALLS